MFKKKEITLKFKLKAFHPYYINNFIKNFSKNFNFRTPLNIKTVILPKKIERFTVLRSPHVDKKARDQFERITYKRALIVKISILNIKEYYALYNILNNLGQQTTGVWLKLTYSSFY